MKHTVAIRWLSIAFLVAMLGFVALPSHADSSKLSIDVSMSWSLRVDVQGKLTAPSGQGVPTAVIRATVDGESVASANTDSNGSFSLSFDIPQHLRSGNRKLVVAFDGRGDSAPAASAGATLSIPDELADGSNETERSSQTDPTGVSTSVPALSSQLTAKADTTYPSNGEVVRITGTLLAPDGAPLTNAGIQLFDDYGEVEEGYVLTDGSGEFSTAYEIPVDRRDSLTLTLRFEPAGGYPGAETSVTLKIDYHEVQTATPSASQFSSTASATPTLTASPTASLTPTPTASASSAPPVTAETASSGTSGSTALIVVMAVGSIIALSAIGVVLAKMKRPVMLGDGSLGLFADDDYADAEDGKDHSTAARTPRRCAN